MFAKLLIALVVFTVGMQQLFAEDLDSRKQRIDQMTAIEKDELRGKQNRFESLSPEDQDKYRALHQELEQRENGERLQVVMKSYYNWLKSLDAVQRNELQELSAEDRIDKIKQFMEQQEREQFRELAAEAAENIKREDIQVIKDWIEAFVGKHQEEILSNESELPDYLNFNRKQPTDLSRKAQGIWHWMLRSRHEKMILPLLEDFQELTEKLQPETKAMLDNMKEDKRLEVLQILLMAAAFSDKRGFDHKVSEDELQEFHETLPPEVKSRLALLTPEEFKRQLKMEYVRRNYIRGGRSRGSGGRGPSGDGRGPRNGPGGDNNRPPRGGGGRDGPGPDNRGPGNPKTTPPKQEKA
ncbi:MAG: hypothetical protein COA78_35815 [Blastopirellula sp.]|nr:MAG: hypothetical protein COA78_35815 [Blastopirellula sp.]